MGMMMKGMGELISKVTKFKNELPEAAQDGVDDSCDHLMMESQKQVPRETGRLAASAQLVPHSSSGAKRSKGVKYGEGALNSNEEVYAAAVHEILKASHKSPTKAKYVEDPLVQGIDDYHDATTHACEAAVRRSFG